MIISTDNLVILIFAAVITILVSFAIGYAISRKGGGDEGESNTNVYIPRSPSEDQIRTLKEEVNRLDALNNRYLNFMLNVPEVVKKLNSSMRFQDITSSIVRLVGDIMSTDRVELYIHMSGDQCLKKVGVSEKDETQVVCPMGEGLIGRAATDLMIRIKGQGDSVYGGKMDNPMEDGLWMAAPIHYSKRLLGVIGIGRVKNSTGDERNLLKMISDIAAVALVNQASLGEAKQEAITDPLTGLFNRRYFLEKAIQFVEQAIIKGKPLSIFLFDIDNFKNYNDTNGHDEGDKLLKELSDVICQITRKTNVIARYGGEEFIVMLPEINKDDCYTYANRLREKIAEHPFPHREKQPLGFVSISGGVASYPSDGSSMQEVIRLADAALYKAKESGRNKIEMHRPFMFSDLGGEEDELLFPSE